MVNFGIIYGISAFGLSENLEIPRDEAQEYIDTYLARFPLVQDFIQRTIEQATRDGYVTTLLGRRRPVPEIRASNRQTRSLGERLAVNSVMQGTAADIIKVAMVRIHRRLRDEGRGVAARPPGARRAARRGAGRRGVDREGARARRDVRRVPARPAARRRRRRRRRLERGEGLATPRNGSGRPRAAARRDVRVPGPTQAAARVGPRPGASLEASQLLDELRSSRSERERARARSRGTSSVTRTGDARARRERELLPVVARERRQVEVLVPRRVGRPARTARRRRAAGRRARPGSARGRGRSPRRRAGRPRPTTARYPSARS